LKGVLDIKGIELRWEEGRVGGSAIEVAAPPKRDPTRPRVEIIAVKVQKAQEKRPYVWTEEVKRYIVKAEHIKSDRDKMWGNYG
jgi:hypothetical protein